MSVWTQRRLHCSGTVEQTAPALGVPWIRQTGHGGRKPVRAAEHRLFLRASTRVAADGGGRSAAEGGAVTPGAAAPPPG